MFALDIYGYSSIFPQSESFGVTQQLRRAAVSVPTNIAEGCGRNTGPDFLRFLHTAYGSLKECESLLIMSRGLEYISEEDYNKLNKRLDVLGKRLYVFMDKLNNS